MDWLWQVLFLIVHLGIGLLGMRVWRLSQVKFVRALHVKYPSLTEERIKQEVSGSDWGWYPLCILLSGPAGLLGVMVAASVTVDITGRRYWIEANGDGRGW